MLPTLLLIAALATQGQSQPIVPVPDLHAETTLRARQLLALRGLQPAEGVYLVSPQDWRADINRDTVYLQSPRRGASIRQGAEVAMWRFEPAGKDEPQLDVPDLVGKTWAEARETIEESGLTLMNNQAERSSDEVITDQYPRPGTRIYARTSLFVKTTPAPGD